MIELLVVVGVLALLAACLLPVFLSMREGGRRTSCLSNERQLGLAMQQYVADEDETLPRGELDAGDLWTSQLYPYVKSVALFQCPDGDTLDGDGKAQPDPSLHLLPIGPVFPVGYGLNSDLGESTDSEGSPQQGNGVNLPALTAPAKTVLFFEVGHGGTIIDPNQNDFDGSVVGNGGDHGSPKTDDNGTPLSDPTYPLSSSNSNSLGFATYATGDIGGRLLNGATKDGMALKGAGENAPRHQGGANYVACDGHAVWLRPAAVSGGDSAVAAECLQGTSSRQPPGCISQTEEKAAGTAAPGYGLTFSIH